MLPREIEKKEELVAPRKREVEKRENSEERAVRDFQIPWFVRGFEINRFGPNSRYPNRPDGLKNSEDVRCTSNDQISEIAVNFYKKLLTSSHTTTTRSVLEAITPSVTAEMNEDLLKEFIREEEVDLKPMEPPKPLGPNGILPYFSNLFRLCWVISCMFYTVLIYILNFVLFRYYLLYNYKFIF